MKNELFLSSSVQQNKTFFEQSIAKNPRPSMQTIWRNGHSLHNCAASRTIRRGCFLLEREVAIDIRFDENHRSESSTCLRGHKFTQIGEMVIAEIDSTRDQIDNHRYRRN